jgi:glutaryl-CoA dehydrogenase (non-decarboxylating)
LISASLTNTVCSSSRSASGARRNVAPFIRENDRKHYFDRDRILGGMAKLGLLGVSVPQEYGGAGMDYISLGIASEELEYLDTSLRVIMSVHAGLSCLTLLSWGTEDQKQRYLVPQAQGKAIAGYGLTEPSAGSDARGIQTTATKKGDRYVLNGEKSWISLADVADNFLVIAWTDLEKKKQGDPSGMTAFIVERRFKGFSSGPMKEKWGILAGNTGLLQDGRRRGAGGERARPAGRRLQDRDVRARSGTVHRRRRRDRIDPRLPRRQREVRQGAQDLRRRDRPASAGQEMIAQMESDYQTARLLWLRSGWLKNNGTRNTRETGLAKWFATVASERAAGDAVRFTARTATRTSIRWAGSTATARAR